MWQLRMQLKLLSTSGMKSVVIPGEHLQHLGCKEPHSRAGWKPGA